MRDAQIPDAGLALGMLESMQGLNAPCLHAGRKPQTVCRDDHRQQSIK
jgi:hypothetical protein